MRSLAILLAGVVVVSACAGNQSDEQADRGPSTTGVSATTSPALAIPTTTQVLVAPTAASSDSLFPDVLEVEMTRSADGSFTFDVTMSSPYDTDARYADAWRIVGPDGTVFGVRELTHGHANEQPFTRSLAGVEIPTDVVIVTVEGRDQLNGWGGATIEASVPQG